MDPYDVDAFAVLDPPRPSDDTTSDDLPVAKEHAPHQPRNSASDGSALGIGHDLDQSYQKTEIRDSVIVMREGPEQYVEARVQERKGRGIQDREALQRLADSYVPPPGLLGEQVAGETETAFQILHRRRVLLIGAEHLDCGQFAAAQRLGLELQKMHPELIVREELSDPDFRLQAHALLVKQEPAAVFVDLRRSDAADIREVARGLVEFTEQLEHYQSYLVLLVPPERTSTFGEQFPGRTHLLSKPSSVEVLERHLVGANARALVTQADSAQDLERLWPPKVKKLADAVSTCIQQGGDSQKLLQELLVNELDSSTSALREKIREQQEEGNSEWLALLLAASVLEGAPPKHIVEAADRMLELNRVEVKQPVPLLRLSPFARLEELTEDHFDSDSGAFRIPGFGNQVLRHFWREHPDLHTWLLNWIGELPDGVRDLERDQLEQLADRVVDLAYEGGVDIPLQLARKWATNKTNKESRTEVSDTPSSHSRRSIAVRLLTTTATDPTLGRDIRQRLWSWSREGDADLKLMTADVCAGIGQSFPRVALTRLKHLANAENDKVRASVHDSVRQIGIQLDVSQFLRYISEWFEGASPARLHLLAGTVADVLKEQSGDIDTQTVTSFWQRALRSMPPEDSRTIVQGWLTAAAAAPPRQRESMVESLVQATNSDSIIIAQVEHASRVGRASLDLSDLDDEPMISVVHHLWTRLDEVDPVWQ